MSSKIEHELDGPCRWCGYNGKDYWQSGSHSEECPWHGVGGMHVREEVLRIHRRDTVIWDAVQSALPKLIQFDDKTPRYLKTK